MPSVQQLTTGELSTTRTACAWLSGHRPVTELLDPVVVAKISTLAADCAAEVERRKRAEQEHRRQATQDHHDPYQEHYTA
ncbi:MAG: hypothetical protein ACRDOL_36355 [Streptosporangiaceae bacterium]